MIAAATAALTVAAAAACGSDSDSADAASSGGDGVSAFLAHLRADGATVGTIDSPPDSSVTNGELDGLLPSIDAAVLKQLGVTKVKAVSSQFAGLVPGLQNGSLDMVTGAFFQTKERCSVMAFGEVEFVYTYAFAVKKGTGDKYKSFSDIKNAGVTLAADNAGYQQQQALAAGVPQSQILAVQSRQDGIDAVLTGRAVAYAAPTRTLDLLKQQNGDKYEVVQISDIKALGTSAAFAPKNKAFRAEYKQAYEAIKKSGELKTIMDKYGASLDETDRLRSTVFTCPTS